MKKEENRTHRKWETESEREEKNQYLKPGGSGVVRVSSSLFVFVRVENRKICKYLFCPRPTHLMRRLFCVFRIYSLKSFAQCQGKDCEHVIKQITSIVKRMIWIFWRNLRWWLILKIIYEQLKFLLT